MAPLTIALGPGFAAGYDVDFVVETMRGHDLGKIIEDGEALPNTGTPGLIAGVGRERVIDSPAEGVILNKMKIADFVEKGQVIATVGDVPGSFSTGILRGIIRDGYKVHKGMKIADIDPRKEEKENCYTISDKARCICRKCCGNSSFQRSPAITVPVSSEFLSGLHIRPSPTE